MLLLVTLALVVASAVLLILGFVQDALGFIYLSMLCAGVAALALFVFARLTKRRSAALVGAGVVAGVGSPYMPADEAPAAEGFEPTSSVAVVAPAAEPARPEPLRPEPVAVSAMAPAEEEDPWAPEDSSDDWGDEILFPIEDYDDLRVAEILPLLGQLEPDELQEVRDRELAGKARATILDRIDDRLNRRPAAVDAPASLTDTASVPAIEAAPEPVAELAPAPAPRKRAATRTAKAEPAPVAEKAPAARKATRTTKAAKATESAMATEPTPAPAPAKKAPAARASTAKAGPAKAGPAKAAAKTAGAAANSANSATSKAAAPAKKAVAKTTKTVTRATPAKRATKKSQ